MSVVIAARSVNRSKHRKSLTKKYFLVLQDEYLGCQIDEKLADFQRFSVRPAEMIFAQRR